MRVNRSKLNRKYLRFFRIVYHIVPKYKIILDGNFIYSALKQNVDIIERLTRLLQGEGLRLYMLKSCYKELCQVGEKTRVAKEFTDAHCDLIDDVGCTGDTPSDKILSYLTSLRTHCPEDESRWRNYFVGTQDKELRGALRRVPGVPILYLNKVILVLEPPSDTSRKHSSELEAAKVSVPGPESDLILRLSLRTGGDGLGAGLSRASGSAGGGAAPSVSAAEAPGAVHVRRKRRATGPNPLSNKRPDKLSQASKRRKTEGRQRRQLA